jgi:flagellar protein FliL
LLDREGKDALAEKIKKEASRAMGFAVAEDDEDDAAANNKEKTDKPTKKGKKKAAPPPLPIKAVHFSNFIVQ